MSQAIFHLHGDLSYFMADQARNTVGFAWDDEREGRVAVKHAAESLGIPHTEIDQFAANGEIIGFDYGLRAGDVIEVWAWIPKPEQVNLRPPLPHPVRFVLDTHLGRLATYLRLLGFDTLYQNDYADSTLAALSHQEGRVLLTRDRGLLKRRIVDFGCCVREQEPKLQLLDLLRRYELVAEIDPWRRCLRCNEPLLPVEKAAIIDQLEPKTQRYFSDFRRCTGCGQLYWRGSHYEHMQSFVDEILAAVALT